MLRLCRDLWSSTDGVSWNLIAANAPYDGYAEMTVYAGKVWAVKQSVWNSADGVNWKQVAGALRAADRRIRIPIVGEPPSPLAPPSGCSFRSRCVKAIARCASDTPLLREVDGQQVACHVV